MIIDMDRYKTHVPLIKRFYTTYIDRGLDYVVGNLSIATGIHIVAVSYFIKDLIKDDEAIDNKIKYLEEFYGNVEVVNRPKYITDKEIENNGN